MKTGVTVSTAAQGASPVATPGSIMMNVGGALVFILLFILAIAWLVRRFNLTSLKHPGSRLLSVKSQCSLGQKAQVAVVEIEGKWLVLGVTAEQVTHLHTLDAPVQEVETATGKPAVDFQAALASLLKKGRKPESPQ
ncbi:MULTISPECIES: flagellar biosynthetic protein FliO [Tenebrionibacter/Tenebrionicola group]|jgi:flagellar protein FliO/FliZ|uniref:Flagellar protein n=3 Tax=Tenebrionibacter/Tenebrionicola group TaxID=2969848 RepID=A0A8K0XXU9_9ENTR|nr:MULTISPECIES: flagellar biosynthetic protein FliO [Tenebrionibacter/Tenebrionicola group]MBK4716731.1 flagellar biosynthetic protein FliO [Tenebrionibacter intestinalis]MBV5096218.1 flagellar biosynthetic protein FliO [Tenebrionicola larvae]